MSTSKFNYLNDKGGLEVLLDRLREFIGDSKDSAVAKALKVNRSSIPTWRERGTIPYTQLCVFAYENDLSFDWLFTGKLPMRMEDAIHDSYIETYGEAPIGDEGKTGYYGTTPTSPGELDMESLEIAIECAELHLGLMKRTVSPAKKAKLIGILYDEISQDDADEIDDNKVIRLIDLASEEEEKNEQKAEMADQDKKLSQ